MTRRVDAPGLGEALPSMELPKAVIGQGQLEAAHLVEAPRPVELERARLLDGVAGELGHGLGAVRLEHEPRRVRRRAAGREQRALLDDDDVGPAAQDELVRDRTADDAGSDDRDAGLDGHRLTLRTCGVGDWAIADPVAAQVGRDAGHGIQADHLASLSATHLSPASSAVIPWLVM